MSKIAAIKEAAALARAKSAHVVPQASNGGMAALKVEGAVSGAMAGVEDSAARNWGGVAADVVQTGASLVEAGDKAAKFKEARVLAQAAKVAAKGGEVGVAVASKATGFAGSMAALSKAAPVAGALVGAALAARSLAKAVKAGVVDGDHEAMERNAKAFAIRGAGAVANAVASLGVVTGVGAGVAIGASVAAELAAGRAERGEDVIPASVAAKLGMRRAKMQGHDEVPALSALSGP